MSARKDVTLFVVAKAGEPVRPLYTSCFRFHAPRRGATRPTSEVAFSQVNPARCGCAERCIAGGARFDYLLYSHEHDLGAGYYTRYRGIGALSLVSNFVTALDVRFSLLFATLEYRKRLDSPLCSDSSPPCRASTDTLSVRHRFLATIQHTCMNL
jgi:hypothetical protein